MASVDVSALSKQQKDELACSYAAMLLHDGELEISEEKINKVLQAAGISVESYYPGLFVKALKGQNIGNLLSNASAGAAPAGGATAAAAAAPTEGKKEEKKEEKPKEEDMDVGGMDDLFGGGDY